MLDPFQVSVYIYTKIFTVIKVNYFSFFNRRHCRYMKKSNTIKRLLSYIALNMTYSEFHNHIRWFEHRNSDIQQGMPNVLAKYRRIHHGPINVMCKLLLLVPYSIPDGCPSIQCQLTELLTGRAWASIQTDVFCITLYASLMNCWNTLSMSSSVMIGSVEFLLAQNSLASFQLNTEPLV